MIKFLALAVFTSISASAFGQFNYGFGAGHIVTKNGDKIKCQIELAVAVGDKIVYKETENGVPKSIRSNDVKSITTPFNYYENITVGKKKRIMSLIVDGKLKLFYHVIMKDGRTYYGNGGRYQFYEPLATTYVIVNEGKYFEIERKEFKGISSILFRSCPELIEKINRKKYKYEDLEKVVTEFNSCG